MMSRMSSSLRMSLKPYSIGTSLSAPSFSADAFLSLLLLDFFLHQTPTYSFFDFFSLPLDLDLDRSFSIGLFSGNSSGTLPNSSFVKFRCSTFSATVWKESMS